MGSNPIARSPLKKRVAQWYADFVALDENGRSPTTPKPALHAADPNLTVVVLAAKYLTSARGYYRKHGQPTKQVGWIQNTCKVLANIYGAIPSREFVPKRFQDLPRRLVAGGKSSANWISCKS